MLGVSGLLDKGAGTAVGHEDEWGWPGFGFVGFGVYGPGGVSRSWVDSGGVAEVRVGVVYVLSDGSTVGWAAE